MKTFSIAFSDKRKKMKTIEARSRKEAIEKAQKIYTAGFAVYKEIIK